MMKKSLDEPEVIKNKGGRPSFEITDEVLNKVEALAARGMTQEQICDCLGIHVSTFFDKKNKFVELSEAVKRGKAKGIAFVTEKLLENVKEKNVTAQIFYLKTQAKWIEKTEQTINITTHEEDLKKLK